VRWASASDQTLLQRAQDDFDVFVAVDRGILHQQNISELRLGVVLLVARSNALAALMPLMPLIPQLAAAIDSVREGQAIVVTASALA